MYQQSKASYTEGTCKQGFTKTNNSCNFTVFFFWNFLRDSLYPVHFSYFLIIYPCFGLIYPMIPIFKISEQKKGIYNIQTIPRKPVPKVYYASL